MNKSIFYIISFCLLTVFVLLACKKEPIPKFHYEYFGLEAGRYVIYDVMEIDHDQALAKHDTTIYQLKTYWGQPYEDNLGRDAREFIRFRRDVTTDPWVLSDLWTGIIDGVRAELIEENQRVVKLVFAPSLSKVWDANAYSLDDEMECYYRDLHQDTTLNSHFLDSTLVVEQANYFNLIDTVRKYEVYQKGVGLVYKHFVDNHYQFASDEVVNGKEVYFTFVETGIE
ncbi:MAG: hypothetical protein MK105_16795 [Crocinitomicaceae bacterium]|nr:hypothetical protein [Crocinitomicaceae bacterium]